MNDVFVYYEDFRPAIKGVVLPDENGDYNIFLNSRFSAEQQRTVYNHEMRHLLLGHHQHQHLSLRQLEAEAETHTALLDKIRQAEAAGLPLVTAILNPPAAPSPPPAPCAARRRPPSGGVSAGHPISLPTSSAALSHTPPASCGGAPAAGAHSALRRALRGSHTGLWY